MADELFQKSFSPLGVKKHHYSIWFISSHVPEADMESRDWSDITWMVKIVIL